MNFEEKIKKILEDVPLDDLIKRKKEKHFVKKNKYEWFFKYNIEEEWKSIKLLDKTFSDKIRVRFNQIKYKTNSSEIYLPFYKVYVKKVDLQ